MKYILISILLLFSTGCVIQHEHNHKHEHYRRREQQNRKFLQEYKTANKCLCCRICNKDTCCCNATNKCWAGCKCH